MSTTTGRRRGRKRAFTATIPLAISDHNLQSRYARGEIKVEDKADIDNPNRTVRRARTVSVYDQMHSRGTLSDPQREAADKYAVLREQEVGASWLSGEPNGRAPSPWQKGHPILTAVQAAAKLRDIHAVLGHRARAIVTLLIVENMPAAAIGARFGVGEREARAWIVAGLERMAEHWGMDERTSASIRSAEIRG